jgi:U5 small nuclear ribonucleoprotein component
MDRLVLELRLPLADAYHKIKHTVEEINAIIDTYKFEKSHQPLLSPSAGNVLFASAQTGCVFSLGSFARKYAS